MSVFNPESSVTDDTRGVSEIIGAVFLLGIVVILISINQAQIVPQENAEIEFSHSQNVRNDLIEVRSSISTAGQADVSQFPTVELGTNYPTRIVAVNPRPPVGRLQTSDAYNISITNQTGPPTNVSTRFLVYRPGYNEIDSSPTWYENSVLYLDARDRGGVAILEDQTLVTDGTLRLTALQNEFQESGTGRVTVELYPAENVTADEIPTGNLTVTLPTRLTGDEYWDQAFDSESVYGGVTTDEYADGVHALKLSINTSKESQELQLNTVGIQSEPSEGGQKQNVGSGDVSSAPTPTPTPTPVDPTFSSLEATVTKENPNGIKEIEFDWELSESTNITLEVDGSSENISGASADGTGTVNVAPPEQRPVTVTGTIDDTGESCSTTIEDGDGDGPFALCS